MGKAKNKLPDGWTDYTPLGKRLTGTRFIPLKVPLKELYKYKVPAEDYFGPGELVEKIKEQNEELGLLIDLTNTTRYYLPSDLPEGVLYYKIFTEGQDVPEDKTILDFKHAVRTFLKQNVDNDKLIGVHCTHGVNRTGYLICRYLIDVCSMSPKRAIELFNKARGHPMERRSYTDDLLTGYKRSNKGMDDPGLELLPGKATVPADPQNSNSEEPPINWPEFGYQGELQRPFFGYQGSENRMPAFGFQESENRSILRPQVFEYHHQNSYGIPEDQNIPNNQSDARWRDDMGANDMRWRDEMVERNDMSWRNEMVGRNDMSWRNEMGEKNDVDLRKMSWRNGMGLSNDMSWRNGLGLGSDMSWRNGMGLRNDVSWRNGMGLSSDMSWRNDMGLRNDVSWGSGMGPRNDVSRGSDMGPRNDVSRGSDMGLRNDMSWMREMIPRSDMTWRNEMGPGNVSEPNDMRGRSATTWTRLSLESFSQPLKGFDLTEPAAFQNYSFNNEQNFPWQNSYPPLRGRTSVRGGDRFPYLRK
ncbi:uncharacterized protein LOC122812116 [Protopterus annectens]|uniref:uncharacterized protein LOC122812116 n=1 Tax=Protopterus annectens TaxID=7888 RepID=UPI001CFB6A82|nr:uncharacterized protein LOC122812116 [Protopterus annectens]